MAVNINQLIEIKGNINEGVKEALKDINQNFTITMIASEDLEPSEDNFYKPRDIDKMKESIENFGIQQNLIVTKKENGKYEIIAGERRYRGNKALLDEGKEKFRYLPCRIIPKVSDTLKNIIIILTNSEARDKSAWEVTEEVSRLKILYENYKKENPAFKGRVREMSAQDLKMSPAQVGRHNKINENLIEPLKEEYKNENINFTAAQEIASLPEEKQEKVLEKVKRGEKVTTTAIKEIKKEIAEPKEDLKKLEDEEQTTIKDFTEDNKDLTEEPESAVNTHGVYKEKFIKNITLEIPKKYGEITIHIAHDPKDDKYRTSYHYQFKNSGGGGAPHEDCRPFSSEQEALANMIDKLHTIGSEEIKAALKAGGYTKDKPKTEVRDIKFIVPTPPTEQPEQPDEYQAAAEKIFIDLLQKEIDIAERDIKKSTDSEEKQYISAYLQLLIKHRDKP